MKTYTKLAVILFFAVSLCNPGLVLADDHFTTDLWAGQHTDVGEVQVENDGINLSIEYNISDPNWCITETHLQVAESLDGIPQKNGNPIPGKFEENDEHECVKMVSYKYDLTENGWDGLTKFYIAAHAVVNEIVDYESDLDGLAAALPNQVTMKVAHPGTGFGDPSYFDVTITGGTSLDGIYDDWCVDVDNTISPGSPYTANVYSSYEDLPVGIIDHPGNLDLVNWIINQGFVGQSSACVGTYTYGDVQRAIWILIDDSLSGAGLGLWSQCRVDEIVAAAIANGEGFEPECGDVVAVILDPVNGQQVTIAQVTFAEIGVPCIPILGGSETAWGGGEDFDGKNWALYFTYPDPDEASSAAASEATAEEQTTNVEDPKPSKKSKKSKK